MTEHEWLHVERALVACGMGDLASERTRLSTRLEGFFREYHLRAQALGLKGFPVAPSVSELVREDDEARYRARLIFQAIGFGCGDEMLNAIWLASSGAEIARVDYAHQRKVGSQLTIALKLPTGATATFTSNQHWDTAALRFLGLAFSDDKPVIDGVYPLPTKTSTGDSSRTPPEVRWMFRVLEWIQMFGGQSFCPSLIDRSHISDVAQAIVAAATHGWLRSEPQSALSRAAGDPQERQKALALLLQDAAVNVSITSEGRRMARRLRFLQQLEGTSQTGLTQIKESIVNVLAKPGEGYEPEDLEEIRDELYAVKILLGETPDD